MSLKDMGQSDSRSNEKQSTESDHKMTQMMEVACQNLKVDVYNYARGFQGNGSYNE